MYAITATNSAEPAELGHPNSPLPHMKEITLGDWAKSPFFIYAPERMGYRTITRLDELIAVGIQPPMYNGHRQMMAVRWFMMNDKTGYALFADYWGKAVRIFSFAVCEHTYAETNVGRCLTKYTCSLCGYAKTVDSSD